MGALRFAPGAEVGRVGGRGAAGSARVLGCWQRSGLPCCYDLFGLRPAAFAAPHPPEKPVLPRGTAMKVLLLRYKPGRETRHKPSFHVSAPKPQHAALLCLSSSHGSPWPCCGSRLTHAKHSGKTPFAVQQELQSSAESRHHGSKVSLQTD